MHQPLEAPTRGNGQGDGKHIDAYVAGWGDLAGPLGDPSEGLEWWQGKRAWVPVMLVAFAREYYRVLARPKATPVTI